MSLRPATVLTGSFLGALALVLAAAPAQAAPPTPAAPQPAGKQAGGTQAAARPATPHPAAATGPVVVAHRGASAYAPENTLAAADKAHELDIDWVENDVQRTKDGELVVLHDETLNRTTDAAQVFPDRAPWKVGDFTLEEIAQLDAGSWFSPAYAGERVPTLEQFLHRLDDNGQKLLLELKKPELYPGIEQDVVIELGKEGWLGHHKRRDLVVQSFNAEAVKTVHGLVPGLRTGYLGTPAVDELPAYARFTDQINPRWTDVSAAYVRAVQSVRGPHGRPLELHTWTVDDGPTAATLAGRGVDGIISNRPDVVRAATGG